MHHIDFIKEIFKMEQERNIQYLMKTCSVSHGIATVALIHSRGSVAIAKDLLTSDTCKQIYGREAREFGIQ